MNTSCFVSLGLYECFCGLCLLFKIIFFLLHFQSMTVKPSWERGLESIYFLLMKLLVHSTFEFLWTKCSLNDDNDTHYKKQSQFVLNRMPHKMWKSRLQLLYLVWFGSERVTFICTSVTLPDHQTYLIGAFQGWAQTKNKSNTTYHKSQG